MPRKRKPTTDTTEPLPATAKSILSLKLGTSLLCPNSRLRENLHTVACALNRARNKALRAWQRWHEDHEEWKPGPLVDKDGSPRLTKAGEPMLASGVFPVTEASEGNDKPVTLPAWLYRAGVRAEPTIAATLISSATKEVESRLKAQMPYTHEGAEKYRWQAILSGAINTDSFRQLCIPLPNQATAIAYDGEFTDAVDDRLAAAVRSTVRQFGLAGAVIAFPLWSRQSSREDLYAVARINVGALTPGHRSILRQVVKGRLKFCDSKLVYDDGARGGPAWFVRLTYEREGKGLNLSVGNVATLKPNLPTCTHPFAIASPSGAAWQVGNGNQFRAQFARLDARRMSMRTSYDVAGHGRKGHGRQRNERDIRPITRAVGNLCNDHASKMVADCMRFCERFDCGSIVYREPYVGSRRYSWFGKGQLQFDWTLFLTKLKHQAWLHGIRLSVEQGKIGDADADRESEGDGQKPSHRSIAASVGAK